MSELTTPKRETLSVTGLGYVGLPVAIAFAKAGHRVIGFDRDPIRSADLRAGRDATRSVSRDDLRTAMLEITNDPGALAGADIHIVTVPTPIDAANKPDLRPLCQATQALARILKAGDLVVYESTVYPGATQEIAVPLLEAGSGLKCGTDFDVGYSPERINPGDKKHQFASIIKVVAGNSPQVTDRLAVLYGSVVEAGIHRAPSIAVAETSKVIENTQRDLNIALMNELAGICQLLAIDTSDVLAAAATKWNFLPFRPGLVGGHCIGVDPYYLTHKAVEIGHVPKVILAGRDTNEAMPEFIARRVLRLCVELERPQPFQITVLGVTYKADVPDTRNSKVVDLIGELQAFGARVQVFDPVADPARVERDHGLQLIPQDRLASADAVVLAVPHTLIMAAGGWDFISPLLRPGATLVADIPAALERDDCPAQVTLWRL
jgi:UDP-N-acetyl-D-galactosamine dehydrogenase